MDGFKPPDEILIHSQYLIIVKYSNTTLKKYHRKASNIFMPVHQIESTTERWGGELDPTERWGGELEKHDECDRIYVVKRWIGSW